MANIKMKELQKDILRSRTCYILDCHSDTEEYLKRHGIPEKHIKKISKAFDLIFEVNQFCCK